MSGFQGRGRGRHWHRPPGNGDLRGANRAPWLYGFQPHFNQTYSPRPPNAWHGPRWDKRVPWRFPTPAAASNVFPPRPHLPFGVSGQIAWEFTSPPSLTPFHFGTESEPNVNESTSVSKDSDCHKSKNSDIVVTPKDSESAQQKCETKTVKEKEENYSNRNQRNDRREKASQLSDSEKRRREGENRHCSRSDERKKDVKNSRTGDYEKKQEESESRRSKISYKSDAAGKSDQKQKVSSSKPGNSHESSVSGSSRSSVSSSKKLNHPPSPLNDSRKCEQNKVPGKQNKPVVSKQTKSVTKQSKPATVKQSKSSATSASKPCSSEDARKNHITKAADRLKKYLQECKGSKDEVLENLLSKAEDRKVGLKSPSTSQDKQCYNPDLQLTAKDLLDIGKIKSSSASTLLKLPSENGSSPDDSSVFFNDPSSTEFIVLDEISVDENSFSDKTRESANSVKVNIGKERLPNGNKYGISRKTGEDGSASKEVVSTPKKSISSSNKSSDIVKQSVPPVSFQSTSSVQLSNKQQNVTGSQPSVSSEGPSSRTRGSSSKERTASSRIEKSTEKHGHTRSIFLPNITPSRSRHTSDSSATNAAEKHNIETTQEDASLNPAKRAKRSRSASINADEQEGANRRKSFSGGAGSSCGPGKSLDDFKQQLLKMNLKDVVTNPNFNRKAEMVMQQLMKEHSQTLNRQLRMLAESRLTGKQATVSADESATQLIQDPLELDTDLAVDLAALPPEFIENLQNIFQMELVDNPDVSEVNDNLVPLPFSDKDGELQNGDVSDVFNSAILGEIVEPESLLMMDQKIAEGVGDADQANLDDLSGEKLADMNLEGNLEYVERKIEYLQNEIKNYEQADPAIKDRIKIENEEINVKEEIFMPEFIDGQCGETEHDDSDLLKENSLFLGDSEEACDGTEVLNEKDHSAKDLQLNVPAPQLRKDDISDALGRSDSELIASDFLGDPSIVTDSPGGETINMCVEKSFPEISGNEQMQDLTPTFNVDSNLENDDQFAAYDMDSEIVPDDQDTGYVVENGVVLGEQAGVYDVDNIENFVDDQVSAFNVDDSMPSLGAADMYNVEGDHLAEYTMEDSSLAQDGTLCTGQNVQAPFDIETSQLDQPACVLQNVQEQSVMFTKNSTPTYNTHHTPSYDIEPPEEPSVFTVSTSSPAPPQLADPVVVSCVSPAMQTESRPDTPKKDNVVHEEEQNIKLVDTSPEADQKTTVPDGDDHAKDQPSGDRSTEEAGSRSSRSEDPCEERQHQAVPSPAIPPRSEPAPLFKSVSFDACTQTEPPVEEELEGNPAITSILNLIKERLLLIDSSSPCGGSSTPSGLESSDILLQNIQAALQNHGCSEGQPRPDVSALRRKKTGFAGRKGRRSYSKAGRGTMSRRSATSDNQCRPVLQRSFSYNSDSNSDAVMPVLSEEIPSSEVSSQWLRDRTIVPDDDQVESERELEEVGVKPSEEPGECSENVDVSDTIREMLRVDKEMQRLLAYKMKLYKKMYQRGGVLSTRSKRSSCDTEMHESMFCSVRGEDLSLFDKSLQQLNEANASGSGGSNIGVSVCSVGGGASGGSDCHQASESKNSTRLEMEVETASNVCPSPQTTSLTPAREVFSGSPAPSIPCTVPTPSSPLSHCFRTRREASPEVGSRSMHLEQSRTSALCDSDSHISSHIRASSTSAPLSQSLNSVGPHQSPMGPVSKSPDCSDSVTQKSHNLQHNSVLVQSPPMVRFPADYCLSVCSTSNMHDVVNSQASIESLLNISDCHPVNDQADASSPVCHQQLQSERNTFDTCIVEDVINSALSEQCDTNNSTNMINSPQKQSNTSHLMEVELTRTHSSKIDDQLKLTDTSVVEAVLNTFALPECTERRPENDLMSSPISESKAEPDSTDGGCEQGEPMIPSTTNSESEGGTTPPTVVNNRSYARRGRRRAMSRFSNRVDIIRDQNDKESSFETLPLKVGGDRFLVSQPRARRGRGRGRRPRGEGFAIRGSPSGHSPREANLTPKHTFDGESLENSDQQRSLHQPDSTRDTPVETPELSEMASTPSRRRRKNAGQITHAKEEPSPVRKEEPKPKGRKKIVIEPVAISDETLSEVPQESIERVEVQEKSAGTVLSVDSPPRRQTRRRTKKVYPDDTTASESDPFILYPMRRPKKRKIEILDAVESPAPAEVVEKVEKVEKNVKVDVAEKEKVTKVEEKIEVEKVEKVLKAEKVSKLERNTKSEKISKVEKATKPEKAEKVPKLEKVSKTEKVEKVTKPEKVPEKIEKVSKLEKVEKIVKPDKIMKQEKVVRTEKKEKEKAAKVEKPRKGPRGEGEKREKAKEKDAKEGTSTGREALSEPPAEGVVAEPEPAVSPGEEPLAKRLPVCRAAEPERVPTPAPASKASSAAATPTKDGNIKDCYIVINPLDVTQYLSKSSGVGKSPDSDEESTDDEDDDEDDEEQEKEEGQEVEEERDDAVERLLERIRRENSAGSTPSDPTQEIESQLALLEELSSHLEESGSHEEEGEATPMAPAPATPADISPRGDPPSVHDDTSVSTFVSDCVSAPSDADVPAKRARLDAAVPVVAPAPSSNPAATTPSSSASPEEYDKDSVSSGDPDSPSKALKHKSRKRKRRTETTEHISFEAHRGSVLDVKTVGRHVLAACEDGNVYCYSLKSGKLKRQYSGHEEAVVCITILEREGAEGEDPVPEFLFTGSLDQKLRCFQFKTGTLVNRPVNLGKPIQCMDEMWGILFMGTKVGEVAKFYTKSFKLNEEFLKCSKDMILAVKATKEGARKVVIVASRNEPVSVRDAHSGLLMRVIGQHLPIHTVYSLRLESSLLYCGTNTGKIPVFQFTSGDEVCKYSAGYGVVCMCIYNHLLFAGCYDGNIYVYSTQDKSFITCIPGPGKMLLCLDVAKNRIIAGSKDNKLEAWPLPPDVKNCIRESKHR